MTSVDSSNTHTDTRARRMNPVTTTSPKTPAWYQISSGGNVLFHVENAQRGAAKQLTPRAGDERPQQNLDGRRQLRALHRGREPLCQRRLRVAPQLIELCDAMYAAHGAVRRTVLDTVELPSQIAITVAIERDTGLTALLGTPVHEAIFANVQIPAARTAMPVIGFATGEVL